MELWGGSWAFGWGSSLTWGPLGDEFPQDLLVCEGPRRAYKGRVAERTSPGLCAWRSLEVVSLVLEEQLGGGEQWAVGSMDVETEADIRAGSQQGRA